MDNKDHFITTQKGCGLGNKEQALQIIDEKSAMLCSVSDAIWDNPEIGFHEQFAADTYCRILSEQGFSVERGLAGIPTAFVGTYGSTPPVIGFLGEFDALPGLSQKAEKLEPSPVCEGKAGHGCGHNLLGVGALAAALAVVKYLKLGHCGTVKFFGCPAEENGSGKGFMARDGIFSGVDVAFSWHPDELTACQMNSTLANYKVRYRFHGRTAHAAICPEAGRSALDAVELMNVGVQFLREHVRPEIRIHYAITDTGGSAPGVVQSHAEVLYLMRAPKLSQVSELYERVNKIAHGAAEMTETHLEIVFEKACSNILLNRTLSEVLQRNMEKLGSVPFDAADLKLAEKIRQTEGMENLQEGYYRECVSQIRDPEVREEFIADTFAPLHGRALPLPVSESITAASSDVGDVSWNCPTAQISATTMPAGTPMHSWQEVAVGKSSIAHKGMLYAGKVLAGAAIDVLKKPEILVRAKNEMEKRTGGSSYKAPIPPEVTPHID